MKPIIDVIIPVYRGLEETSECIVSALETIDFNIANLIVINDCSPEPRLTEYLRDLAAKNKIQLLENEENLGFVATVNRGMKLNPANDVLLLNSDVEVANDWLERIQDVAYHADNIGSVTPFSNNATICSFPNFCEDNELFENLSVAEIDNLFSQNLSEADYVDVPTGVGFCMFIRRDCLDEVGLFDEETFGKGYGEENDWCQRAIKGNWRNVHALHVFAYHKGGVSFAEEQDPRKEKALELLNGLHPNYQPDVMSFITKDPAKYARLKVLLSYVSKNDKATVLAVSHGMGGGVIEHIEELSYYLMPRVNTLLLQPVNGSVVKLSFSMLSNVNDTLFFDVESQYDELIAILRFCCVDNVHFHHTMQLPTSIWGISKDLNCEHDVTIHDYYHINGNPSLTDSNGIFCGDSDEVDQECAEHYPIPVSAQQWRDNQKVLLESAKRVIFPSSDTKQRFCQYFSLNNTVVAQHPDGLLHDFYSQDITDIAPRKKLKVLVLGAISREKGADILESVASALAKSNIEFHLLGYAYRPLKAVITHGKYDKSDLAAKMQALAPDVIWFPALCPETYSYTLSSAMLSQSAIVAPDLGAFPERLASRSNAFVVPWNQTTEQWSDFWHSMLKGVPSIGSVANLDRVFGYEQFYADGYVDFAISSTGSKLLLDDDLLLRVVEKRKLEIIGKREKLLAKAVKFKHARFTKWLVKLVPYSLQARLRRYLMRQ
ncbi:glycosyltransferase [Motilimonas pumila]|uniref:Glycosyltransferase n=1 Tax=Motilimonas pumila TaxID=2303987 RepID=A0A418YDY4_9GAMM|nr:glycosyltransferase [Motilimonas pumila]RJG42739.1 glycosyltransferase [Motilimonas pumila]